MSDRFICIACWQEFLVTESDRGARGGKVVCPHCGYIQTGTSMPASDAVSGHDTAAELPAQPVRHTENYQWAPGDAARATSPNVLADELSGTEENSDPKIGDESTSETPDLPDGFEGEPTPPLGYTPPFNDGEGVEQAGPFSESADVYEPLSSSDQEAFNSSQQIPEAPIRLVWQLKTASGLKLKFNDMESLLAWRQKVGTSGQATISPDGTRWCDFSVFVREYEAGAEPWVAFLTAAGLDMDEPPPPSSANVSQTTIRPISGNSGEAHTNSQQGHAANGSSTPAYSNGSLGQSKMTASNQFTFQVTERPKSPVGKYVIIGLLGVVLLAGAVFALLHFSGQL